MGVMYLQKDNQRKVYHMEGPPLVLRLGLYDQDYLPNSTKAE